MFGGGGGNRKIKSSVLDGGHSTFSDYDTGSLANINSIEDKSEFSSTAK